MRFTLGSPIPDQKMLVGAVAVVMVITSMYK